LKSELDTKYVPVIAFADEVAKACGSWQYLVACIGLSQRQLYEVFRVHLPKAECKELTGLLSAGTRQRSETGAALSSEEITIMSISIL
jgi:hypothetical protein